MILADKIIRLRKKNGWSQEEFAEKMHVSRQAVSKWEAAQTTPDLEKILQISHLFGVTTDYLLKDEIEDEEFTDTSNDTPVKKVTLSQANEYLEIRKEASAKIALATCLCIISPIPLLLLLAFSEFANGPITDGFAVGGGLTVLFVAVAIAVAIYIRTGFQNAPYEFLEKEPFETEYGVTGFAKEKQKSYRPTYIKYNIIGACTCILSPVPLICTAIAGNSLMVMLVICVTLFVVSIGVSFFVVSGVQWASMQKLLKEGEFSAKNKHKETVETIYWLIVTAVYLGWSFLSGDWHITWIVWPISGILSAAIGVICDLVFSKESE